jgi:SAM-dependent methyltransferase
MTSNPSSADWAEARGQQWRERRVGLEGMLAPVDAPLISALRLDGPCRIADIGCGCGGTTLELLRRAPRGSVVHGFDISPPLIEEARSRSGRHDPAAVFKVADVATAAPPGPAYDRLVSRFAIMFFVDPSSAFANLLRWLAPGGRFAFAVWGPLTENPWSTMVRDVVASVVELPLFDPEGPGPFRYGDAEKLLTALERAGFGELGAEPWRGALPIGGGLPAAEAASFALESSSFRELLAGAGEQALEDARGALTAQFSRHQRDGTVRIEASVLVCTGAHPV